MTAALTSCCPASSACWSPRRLLSGHARRRSPPRDLIERTVQQLLRRLVGQEVLIHSVEPVSESRADFFLTIPDGDARWLAEISASVAPYDRGCGQIHLALLDAAGERVEVGYVYTMASGRTGEGRRTRCWLKRLGLSRLYADRLAMEDGDLGALRGRLARAVETYGVEQIMNRPLEIGDRSRLSPLAE